MDIGAWTVWTLDADGLATRLEFYLDHQEARPSKPPDSRGSLRRRRDSR